MAINNIDRELGWDDQISNDSPDIVVLPEGEYQFTIDHFDRERHNGSDKLPPCNKAVVFLRISTPNGDAVVRDNLFLHTKCEGRLCAFFLCLGLRKHGEPLRMDFPAIVGRSGRVKLGVRTYNGNQYNEVKRYLEPAGAPAAPAYQAPAYQAPAYQPQPQYQQQTIQQQAAPAPGGYTPGIF